MAQKRKVRVGWGDVRKDVLAQDISRAAIGDTLPSVGEIAARTGASENTVKRAVRDLAHSGYLELAQGRKATVISTIPTDLRGLSQHSEDLGARLKVVDAMVRLTEAAEDDDARAAARALRLGDDQPLVLVDRVRTRPPHRSIDRRWDRAYMPAHLLSARVLKLDFSGSAPVSLMAEQAAAGLRRTARRIAVSAQLGDQRTLARLDLQQPSAVMRIVQVSITRTDGKLVPYEYLVSFAAEGWELGYNLETRQEKD